MRLIGLTGSMGSGKSTVAGMLKKLGADVVDSDQLAREVVCPGERAYREIIGYFGDGLLQPDGTINRKKLAQIVFQNEDALAFLNEKTHRDIGILKTRLFKELYTRNQDCVIVYVVPLLFEKKMQNEFQKTILVRIDKKLQLDRLVKQRGFSEEEVLARLRHQMPQEEKMSLADLLIDNNGTLEETGKTVSEIFPEIENLPHIPPESLPFHHL
ncbi:MAG: dephospho-CoA kinase [Deltaproteobacteria bacterium]|nr:dephospho-CoA kinase [Deltaproteobacteria bacterium]